MEKLEKTLEKIEPGREEIRPFVEKPIYEGFQKVEDKVYDGLTGKKYWM